ncbi:MAG TPA: hypothetical protein VH761_09360 [Ilumatobacteraceae bacterium]
MSARRVTSGVVAALVVAASVSSCSESKTSDAATTVGGATTTSAAPVEETVAPTSTSAAPEPSLASTTDGPPTDADAEITAAFTTFFDGVDPDIDRKVAVLEHGEQLRQMIVDAAADPQFQQLTTAVTSVTMLSDGDCATAGEVAPCAGVVHDMFVGGLPAMVGLQSHAVEIGGVWKVSAKSWCAIVEIGGASCPTLSEG